MATEVARLKAYLDADDRGFHRVVNRADSTMHKVGRSIGLAAAAAGAAVGVGLGIAAKVGFDEFKQGALSAAQTNAVLKSTGGIANVTRKHVERLGKTMMNLSGIDDEVVKSGENILLTFRGIRNETGKGNDIFDQATKATLDLSVAMGKDMTSSAVLVGKALQDPIRGLGALRRVGIQFTVAQEEQIKKMVESGHVMAAQKMILAELNKEFGGSAVAMGKTLPGAISRLREQFKNFLGDLVSRVEPAVSRFLDRFTRARGFTAKLHVVWIGLRQAARDLYKNIRIALFGETTRRPIQLPSGKILEWDTRSSQGLVDAISKGIQSVDWRNVAKVMAGGFGSAFGDAVKKFVSVKFTAKDFVRLIGLDPDHDYGADLDKWLREQLGRFLASFKPDWGGLSKLGPPPFLNEAKRAFHSFMNWISGSFALALKSAVIGAFAPLPVAVLQKLAQVGGVIVRQLSSWVGSARRGAGRVVSGIVSAFSSLPGQLAGLMRAALNAVIRIWNNLRIPGFHVGLPGPVPDLNFGGFDLPNIPEVARGGIVRARPGGTLLRAGEGGLDEAIIPLRRGAALAGNITVNYYAGVFVRESQAAQDIQRILEKNKRRGGR
jgi:hypothetical protein